MLEDKEEITEKAMLEKWNFLLHTFLNTLFIKISQFPGYFYIGDFSVINY